jgi:hypothetical protein
VDAPGGHGFPARARWELLLGPTNGSGADRAMERNKQDPSEHEDDPVRQLAQMMRDLGPVSFEGFMPSDFLMAG